MLNLSLYFLTLVSTVSLTFGLQRKLGVVEFNCSNPSDTHNNRLVVVEAITEQDKIYYLWDFGSKPSFLIASVSLQTRIALNCSRFLNYGSDSIYFSNTPTFMIGTVFSKLYEFNDQYDSGIMGTNSSDIKLYNTEELKWSINTSEIVDEIARVVVTACGNVGNSSSNCSVKLTVCVYTEDGKAIHPPHLLHTANSSQVDLILANLTTSFNNSRFAAELVAFSTAENATAKSIVKKTIDDENTPGIFTMDTLVFENQEKPAYDKRGYLQWRPVVYTTPETTASKSSGLRNYNTTNLIDRDSLNYTLLHAVLGKRFSAVFMTTENVSFGSSTDKFYKSTNYNAWSFIMGIGIVPSLPFSLLVFCIIVFGLGIPAVIIIGGMIFIIFKKIRT